MTYTLFSVVYGHILWYTIGFVSGIYYFLLCEDLIILPGFYFI